MPKASAKTALPACGCNRSCHCQRAPRCRCHDLNALLVLALWDFGRMVRRHQTR